MPTYYLKIEFENDDDATPYADGDVALPGGLVRKVGALTYTAATNLIPASRVTVAPSSNAPGALLRAAIDNTAVDHSDRDLLLSLAHRFDVKIPNVEVPAL